MKKCIKADCPYPAIKGEPYCEGHRPGGISTVGYTGAAEPPIVITGGSVTVEFDESSIRPVGGGKFTNPNKKIAHIEIVGDYDPNSGEVRNGNVIVRVYYTTP